MFRHAVYPFALALGTLGANYSALAAQSRDSSAVRLVVNLPAYRLDAVTPRGRIAAIRIAIGTRRSRTPTGTFAVSELTWNPWWFPPPSDWARNDTVTPPCPTNPMGQVKLGFGHGYFIHGTPASASIGSAASHGCVRALNIDALALAELLVEHVQPEALGDVRAWAASKSTRRLQLRTPVPLEIRYDLAEVIGDSLHLYPDVYRRAPQSAARALIALRAIDRAGWHRDQVDIERLAGWIERSRRGAVAVAVRDLMAAELARGPFSLR